MAFVFFVVVCIVLCCVVLCCVVLCCCVVHNTVSLFFLSLSFEPNLVLFSIILFVNLMIAYRKTT